MTKVKHEIHISNLKRIRVSKRMTQEMLSSRSGVPIKTIGNLEQLRRDINHCRVDIIYRLSQALDCDMLEILDQDKLRAQLPHTLSSYSITNSSLEVG